jgi:anti-anti-sigma factor
MLLTVTENDDGSVKIQIGEKFTFDCHREMRAAYEGRKTSTQYFVDLAQTDYIDSAALGMLLLLREASGSDTHNIQIINCKSSVKKVLEIANFGLMFTIN